MINLNTKRGRLDFGREGEVFVYNIFVQKGIDATHLEPGINQKDPYENMQWGDILLNESNTHIDVKRTNFVSRNCVNNFKGDYFIFIPGNLDPRNAWVASAEIIRSYMKKVEDGGNLIPPRPGSNDLGWRFTGRLEKSVSLLKFIKQRMI